MRIGIISRGDPFTSFSGTEILARNLSYELAKQGHTIDLVFEGSEEKAELLNQLSNLNLHSLKIRRIPFLSAFAFRRRCFQSCSMLLSKFDIDVLLALGAGTFPGYIFNRLKKQKKRTMLVYYAMDSMSMEYARSRKYQERQTTFSLLKQRLYYFGLIRSDKLSCEKADLVLASSKDTLEHLVSDYHIPEAKLKLLYEGIPDSFADGIQVSEPVVPTFLHISGNVRKGTIFFLKALKVLEQQYGVKARAIIIRANDDIVRLTKEFGVNAQVYPFVSVAELKHHLASCTALVAPSLSEGFCLPVVEAMTFGKPCIVSNVGSLPELVQNGKNGSIVVTANEFKLAQSMFEMATKNSLRAEYRINAHNRAQEFTISSTVKNFLELIKIMENHATNCESQKGTLGASDKRKDF
jgi:glycosyltransferase involved in cell wall biosynthesis